MTQSKSTLNQSALQSQNVRTANLLELTYQELQTFSESDDFWNLFDTAFGKGYNRTAATKLRSQWQSGDFSQFPAVEIISSSILGNANGAYATSNNKIYLSETFVNTATTASLSAGGR